MIALDPILIRKQLRIETLSAIHIGTGERLGPKEFAQRRNQIFVAKPEKIMALVRSSPNLESAFLDFCEDGQQTLSDFLQKQEVRFQEIADYYVTAIGNVGRSIPIFIKTIEGKPYLPGSSLKGAFRSALFRSRVIANNGVRIAAEEAVKNNIEKIRRQRGRTYSRWQKKIGKDVERTFFGKDEHHDIMRCLQFGDSTTCESKDLCIAEVCILSIDAKGDLNLAREPRRPDRKMRPVTPELLPKGVKIVSPFTINYYLLRDTPPVNCLSFRERIKYIKAWLAECNRAAQDLIQQEIDFFNRHPFNGKRQMALWYETLRDQLQQLEKTGNQCLLHIAWGSGWDAKTITDQFDETLFDEVRQALKMKVGRPSVLRHDGQRGVSPPLPKNDSPKSRKIVFENSEPKEPLGWVKLTVEEVTD